MVRADYVVVGAGSAGCAVARRLAESGASVVVLEAGGRDTARGVKNLLEIPGAVAVMLSTPQLKKLVDWGYKSVPQTSAWGRVIPQTRGRVLGGSSSVNGMLFVRGNRQNFDDWAADGAEGWSYEDVLPAFKRLEDWEDGAGELRGAGGPVKVRRQKDLTEASRSFIDAATDRLAVPFLDDYNGPEQEGVGVFQLSADRGVRYSAARAYLRTDPPDNLLVLTDADAARIVLSGGRATGVEVVGADGERQVIAADREVIVSAGVFGSPKLLQLSGIGPAALLRQHGIEVVSDLPVGDNLHDHLFVPVSFRMDSALRRPTPAYFMRGLARARLHRLGWASGSQFEATGFVRSSLSGAIPDLQLHALYWVYPFPNQDGDKAVRPPTSKPGLSVFPTLIYPESRGTVRIAGPDPALPPLIDPAYLTAGKDAEVLMEGISIVREVMAGTGDNQGEIRPGPDYTDSAELRRFLPNIVHSVYHPVGTCRIGSDERAVVDPQLRVRGVEGLRVADASVMPSVTGGNTNAPSIMIGERCADLVLGTEAAK
ncbi:GMC family oxidoreductase N-terminal domain-containing protein [Actinomadura sp. BRA 177]|uniref:GMC family oxidoreductase n=1 Tax=Actinomadura sp. BRA 177 TaxID=2745202 RepID=UPI0015960992|nr:GMC family oxidoreductase N-terminal domain-containing protein [Actinomadura sp. BRA 177]NVI89038.1 GMC family oxidoreductase N-terminal domain-containing protein [Actinomadura sp. BRA 177]